MYKRVLIVLFSLATLAIAQNCAAPSNGNGNGITGAYYTGINFDQLAYTQVDPTVNFNYGAGAPADLPNDLFSIKWTGTIYPRYTDTYTFYANSDDGVRVLVNGVVVVDSYFDHGAFESSGSPVSLAVNQPATIEVQYYERGGLAIIQVSWSSACQAKEILPTSQLYTGALVCVGPIAEHATATVTCPSNQIIRDVQFASYGTPTGSCGGFSIGSCNSASSISYAKTQCLTKNSCSISAENANFGDPCGGTFKAFAIQAVCSPVAPTVAPTPVPATPVPPTRVPATPVPPTRVPATPVPPTRVPATPVPATPVPTTGSGSTIYVGPTRAITDPAAAISQLVAGGTIIIDDGIYATFFDVPDNVPGFTIKSASGNPYGCVLDGQGGAGANHRLSWGKGVIHLRSPGTIQGIGFINGGGADDTGDGEAGLYAESFASPGVINVVNCTFDNCENGIFVPGHAAGSPGENVNIKLYGCIFGKNSPNAITHQGSASHNFYISAASLESYGCIHYPALNGNNVKSRAPITKLYDSYNRHDAGRCVDYPDAGQLEIRGGVYSGTINDVSANFFDYAGESISNGVYTPVLDGMKIYIARFNEVFWNNVPTSWGSFTITFTNVQQYWLASNSGVVLQGQPIVGLLTSNPGNPLVAQPVPDLPSWASQPATQAPTPIPATAAPTAPAGSGPTIYVGPTRAITDPAAAVGQLVAGGTMIIDDGVYATFFDVPDNVGGFTIKSASGNPYKCVLDGQGGAGANHRLSWGKGVIHLRSPGTIQGIGFINGGGADDTGDGEAGLYAENFVAPGVINVVNCTFDNCENGIFVPGHAAGSPGENVQIKLYGCIFGKNSPNAITHQGSASHNFYISAVSLESYGCIHYPALNGNNVKSRALSTKLYDAYNRHDAGRCVDIPDAGQLEIRGGVYSGTLNAASSNFFDYAGESTNNGVFATVLDGMSIYGGRFIETIWNNVAGFTITFTNVKQYWITGGNTAFNLQGPGTIAGLQSNYDGSPPVPQPTPVLPPWAM